MQYKPHTDFKVPDYSVKIPEMGFKNLIDIQHDIFTKQLKNKKMICDFKKVITNGKYYVICLTDYGKIHQSFQNSKDTWFVEVYVGEPEFGTSIGAAKGPVQGKEKAIKTGMEIIEDDLMRMGIADAAVKKLKGIMKVEGVHGLGVHSDNTINIKVIDNASQDRAFKWLAYLDNGKAVATLGQLEIDTIPIIIETKPMAVAQAGLSSAGESGFIFSQPDYTVQGNSTILRMLLFLLIVSIIVYVAYTSSKSSLI